MRFAFLLPPHNYLRVLHVFVCSLLLPCKLKSSALCVGVKTLYDTIDNNPFVEVITIKESDVSSTVSRYSRVTSLARRAARLQHRKIVHARPGMSSSRSDIRFQGGTCNSLELFDNIDNIGLKMIPSTIGKMSFKPD